MESNSSVNEQEILDNLYRLFGEKVFKEMQNRDESIPAEEFFNNLMDTSLEFCVKISDSINRIEKESRNADVSFVPQTSVVEVPSQTIPGKRCPRCGDLCDDDSIFCSSCGAKFSEIQATPVPATIYCTNCGAKLDSDSIFCGDCGHKVEK